MSSQTRQISSSLPWPYNYIRCTTVLTDIQNLVKEKQLDHTQTYPGLIIIGANRDPDESSDVNADS